MNSAARALVATSCYFGLLMLLAFNADVPAHRFFDTSAATGSAANDLQVIRGYLGVIAFVLIHCFAALCGIWWKLTGPTR